MSISSHAHITIVRARYCRQKGYHKQNGHLNTAQHTHNIQYTILPRFRLPKYMVLEPADCALIDVHKFQIFRLLWISKASRRLLVDQDQRVGCQVCPLTSAALQVDQLHLWSVNCFGISFGGDINIEPDAIITSSAQCECKAADAKSAM